MRTNTIQRTSLFGDDIYSDSTLVLCLIYVEFLMFLMLVLTLADGLCCAWFVWPVVCWCRCLEIGTGSISWGKLSKFHLKTETESSSRNVMF
jgi:hypothetical protein